MSKVWILISEATLIRSSDKAGLYKIDGEEHWIPWSQIRDDSIDKDGESGELWITEWIADEKEIEGDDEEESDE